MRQKGLINMHIKEYVYVCLGIESTSRAYNMRSTGFKARGRPRKK